MKRSAAATAALALGCLMLLAGSGSINRTPVYTASGSAFDVGSAGHHGGASGADFNATDVMFLQMLIPHHGQGLAIVRLAKNRAVRAEVKVLAAAIEATQGSEVENMVGWLNAWRQPLTPPTDSHAAHGGPPGTTAIEIDRLAKTPDADFERFFLGMLITHQNGAVGMSRIETKSGIHPPARELARRIDQSRTAQIKQMQGYLVA